MDSFHEERYSRGGIPDRQAGRRGHSQRENYGSRPGRRSVDARQLIEESRHGLEQSHHSNPRRRKSQRTDFKHSISDLYHVLSDALKFYQEIRATFDRDIQDIKPYAEPKLLDQLWSSKIKKTGQRSNGDRSHRERESKNETTRRNSDVSFGSIASEVIENMRSTVEAAKEVHPREAAENAHDVSRKLSKNYSELVELLQTAHPRTKTTDLLMTELKMLLTFLDHNGARQGDTHGHDDHRSHAESGNQGYDDQREREQYDEQGSGDEQAQGKTGLLLMGSY